jgi:hypothetical protein
VLPAFRRVVNKKIHFLKAFVPRVNVCVCVCSSHATALHRFSKQLIEKRDFHVRRRVIAKAADRRKSSAPGGGGEGKSS